MTRILIGILLLVSVLAPTRVHSQHYYAVVITTFGPDNYPGFPAAPNGILLPSANSALWGDTYLIWQSVNSQGYDNTYVFYNAGIDFGSLDPQYIPPHGTSVTNAAASASNISNYFQTQLKSQMTDDDVLFVWVFGHGNDNGGVAHLEFANGDLVSPLTFSSWFNGVHYKKRIIVMASQTLSIHPPPSVTLCLLNQTCPLSCSTCLVAK